MFYFLPFCLEIKTESLSEEEKQQFMIPNPNYRKKRKHGITAVF